ncbi:MAG: hypothetical protein O7E55_05745 [Chloroflexi bacterium]|nr:hypothetical protein [Chloroflexota bacterium]
MYKVLLLIFVAIVVPLGIWGLIELKNYFNEKNQQDIANEIKDVSPAYEVTAMQLESEYDANEEAAQEKYKGEVVLISGLLRGYRRSSSPPLIIFISDDWLWDVRCRMPNSQVETINKIIKEHRVPVGISPPQPNHPITLVSVQMKGVVGSHKSLIFIELDGCTFEQILRR